MVLPPGPRAPMVAQTALFLRRPFEFLESCRNRYGDIFGVRLGFMGRGRGVVVGSSVLVREALTSLGDVLSGGQGNEPLRPVMGDGSVGLLDGEPHARRRRLLMPPFHGERMRSYAEVMREITAEHLTRWPRGVAFPLLPRLIDLALEIILRTVFGMERAELDALRDQLQRLLRVLANPMVLMLPALQRDLGPLTPWRRFLRERAATDALLFKRIAAARADDLSREDILTMLAAAVDEDGRPLTDGELRDELMTLLLAGHETSATSLAWVFDCLLSHPETLTRVMSELADVVRGESLQATHVARLDVLEATIREALRLRPAAPGAFRKATEPVSLGGYEIPAGTVVFASSYLVNSQPDVYPEPQRFDPARFLGTKPDPYAWIPFGGGSRRCIGMAYALYEMKVVCATVLSSLRLEAAGKLPTPVTCRAVFQSPAGGLRVRCAAR